MNVAACRASFARHHLTLAPRTPHLAHAAARAEGRRGVVKLLSNSFLRVGALDFSHGTVIEGVGIAHKEGVVDDLPESVDDAKLKSAVDTLLAKHSAEVVKVYLHSFNTMNESQWKNLDALLKEDTRLQF